MSQADFCPQCDSSNITKDCVNDYSDEDQNGNGFNNVTWECECEDCGCEWTVENRTTYSVDVEITKHGKESEELDMWINDILENYINESPTLYLDLLEACDDLGLDKSKMDKRWQDFNFYGKEEELTYSDVKKLLLGDE